MTTSHPATIMIKEKLHKIQLQLLNELENANILWNADTTIYPPICYLPYLVTLTMINKSNKRLTLLSDILENDSKLTSYYDLFSKFNIGNIIKFDDIYYTKDYQKSFLSVTNLITMADVIQCMKTNGDIEIDTRPASNLIYILQIITNIIHFDISHVLVGENELPLYKCIKLLLLDKYDKVLNIIEVPTFPNLAGNDIHSQLFIGANEILGLEPQHTNFDDMILLLSTAETKCRSTYVAVSFLTDQFHVLKKHWKNNPNKNDKSTGTGKSLDGIEGNREGFEPSLGGKFVIINWSNKKVVYTLDLDSPAGFFIVSNHLYIANNRLNYISVIDLKTRIEIRRIENRAFNCLHSIHYSADNQTILITSTGIDAIIETNLQGETLNDWYATEHEYTLTPKGDQRIVRRDFNHHHYTYPTLHQTTHINSAMFLNENYILATLFHQGLLIRIHRQNGKSKVLLSGLKCPHGIKRFKSMTNQNIEWMLCNTKQNEIRFLNDTFSIVQKMLLEDVNWLQDASQLENGNIIIADANNSRIIEIDPIENTVVSEYNYSIDWRIYQISDLAEFTKDIDESECLFSF